MDSLLGVRTLVPEPLWRNWSKSTPRQSYNTWMSWLLSRGFRSLFVALFVSIIALFGYLSTRESPAVDALQSSIHHVGTAQKMHPFSGAFTKFPTLSALPKEQQRMTVIAVWNGDDVPTYMRHYFHGIQLNADVLDLLFINRLLREDQRCMDFEAKGLNITWGGNIKVHCMTNEEWKRRHVDFMCSSEYGWNCNPTEYDEVTKEYAVREDPRSYNWRPFRGHVFRDLFADAASPFWAWMDLDVLPGNFARYPFNILSQVSLMTGVSGDEPLFLAGQLVAFNLQDKALGTAWKKFPELKSADHFTKYIEGKMPESAEERYWSYGYLRTDDTLPGSELSYVIYPDIHGDDFLDRKWNTRNAATAYLMSGRDVLLTGINSTREQIEGMFELDRLDPIDDLGGIGWTVGEDGSGYLLERPSIEPAKAKELAISDAERRYGSVQVHNGLVEDKIIRDDCMPKRWSQCVPHHPLELTYPPLLRSSLVRFKEQPAGHVLRRLEKDNRPRGYERKLLKHHQKSKNLDWFELPPFDITEDMVLRYNFDFIEVWRMGSTRNETLYYRKKGKESIG